MDAQIPADLREYPLSRRKKRMLPLAELCKWSSVLGIIGLFLALLFPVFCKHRGSRREPCLDNLHFIGFSMEMYRQDYDDHYPPAAQWMDGASPYNKNESTFRCPELVKEVPTAYGYAFNRHLSLLPGKKITDPATTPLLYDANNMERNASAPGLTGLATPPRHGERNTVVFADRHVKVVGALQTKGR